MRKLRLPLLISSAILVFFQFARGQWSLAGVPRARYCNAVHILDQRTAVIAGGYEHGDSIESVFISTDRDSSWNINLDITRPWLRGIGFPDIGLGVAVGENGRVIRSTDEGNTWIASNLPAPAANRNFNGVFFANINTVYAVGGNASSDSVQTIIKSTDAGVTWSVQLDTLGPWLHAVYFADANHGYAVGDGGVVLKTVNGGVVWTALSLTGNFVTRNYNALYFSNDSTGFIVGGYPANDSIQTILSTTDGGNTWNIIMDQLGPMLNGISFADSAQAFVVGNHGVLMQSNDAGNTWNYVTLPAPVQSADTNNLNAVYFFNRGYGLAVGDNGMVIQFIDSLGSLADVLTTVASELTPTSATIGGLVNPHNNATNVWFEYGTTPALGDTLIPVNHIYYGTANQQVTAQLTGLTPNTFYYFVLKGANTAGVSTGNQEQLYTSDCEIPNCSFEYWDSFYTPKQPTFWLEMGLARQVASYDGSLAVELFGDSTNPDGFGGAVILGMVQNNDIVGGIPMPQRPDSLTFHTRYNIATGDTAFALIIWKKNGVNLDSILWPITGNTVGSWTKVTLPVHYSFSYLPDSVIVGFVSTNVFAQHPNFRSILAVDEVSFIGIDSVLPNWNFELWDSLLLFKPINWTAGTGFKVYKAGNIVRTSDAYSGNYALLLSNGAGIAVAPPALPNLDSTYGQHPYFPIAGRHNTINAYVKFLQQAHDTLSIRLSLFNNGVVIGSAVLFVDSIYPNYTPLSAVISYNSLLVPDSAALFITLQSGPVPHNSMAYIDLLSFDGFAGEVAVNEIPEEEANVFKIYPNPAFDYITIKWRGDNQNPFQIFDFEGRVVFEGLTNVNNTINLSGFSQGLYMIKILNDKLVTTGKFELLR